MLCSLLLRTRLYLRSLLTPFLLATMTRSSESEATAHYCLSLSLELVVMSVACGP
jgi:hypothetical protein